MSGTLKKQTESTASTPMSTGRRNTSKTLQPNESLTIYEMIGQVRNKNVLNGFLGNKINGNYFKIKFQEALTLTEKLTEVVGTKTVNKSFDDYCRYT